MFTIQSYDIKYQNYLVRFLQECLPQSGRKLELTGRHKIYCNINDSFEDFWCLFDDENIIGTVALKRLDARRCELKSLYLLEKYHGMKLGCQLLQTAIRKAQQDGYQEILLDTLSSSKKAISLYEKAGFIRTERYNTNYTADVFMSLKFGE